MADDGVTNPGKDSDYDRALALERVKENQRAYWRRWLRTYLDQCGERNVDPADEANQAPFLERLASAGKEPWQCEQAQRAVGL